MNSGKPSSKPDLYVIARIINVLKEKRMMNRTALATSTGLAYDKLVNYLSWMSERKFIEIDDDGNVKLTKAGTDAYNELVQWIMKYVGQLRFPRLRPRT